MKELTSTPILTSSFKLDWDPPEGMASTYRVCVGNGSVTEAIVYESTYTAINLVPGSVYNITVWAQVNKSLEGKPVSIQAFTSKYVQRQR